MTTVGISVVLYVDTVCRYFFVLMCRIVTCEGSGFLQNFGIYLPE